MTETVELTMADQNVAYELIHFKGTLNEATKIVARHRLAAQSPPTAEHGDAVEAGFEFRKGDRVCKVKGSSWQGRVVGFYSTDLTPEGYAVESEREPGSVQIYPRAAIRALASQEADNG